MSSAVQPPTQVDTEMVLDFIRESDRPDIPPILPLLSLPAIINHYMGEVCVSTDALFELIGMNRSTGYRILNGTRRPSRDTLIALARALGLDYQKTQDLLKSGRVAQLTPRNERDYLIVFAIIKEYSVGDINSLLAQQGHKVLSGE